MARVLLTIPFLLVLILAGICQGQAAIENVALNRPYTLEPAPNYELCTDRGDKLQLTDGRYASDKTIWIDKRTIGWALKSGMAEMTIDLGRVQHIRGVTFNTAAGKSGVRWPLAILILVSENARDYRYVGDLVRLDEEDNGPVGYGYRVHKFKTEKLHTRGRYVKLIAMRSGLFTFVNEVEVYGGSKSEMPDDAGGVTVANIRQFVKEAQYQVYVRRRLIRDLKVIERTARSLDAGVEDILERIDSIRSRIDSAQFDGRGSFSASLPLNNLHERVFSLQANVWRHKFKQPVIVWQKNHWDMLSPTEMPSPGPVSIDVAMMSNEFRSAAFNISSSDDQKTKVRLQITGLPGGTNPGYITVHKVVFTDTAEGVPVAAALPVVSPEDGMYSVELLPGLTQQIWLTFHPEDIPAGEYKGQIIVEPFGIEVPIRLKVYPLRFPDKPSLHLGGWDYTDGTGSRDVTEQNMFPLITHLREHFVDTTWAQSSVLALGQYDSKGKMTVEPDAKLFEEWIFRWRGARRYMVFLSANEKFAGFRMGTPAFKNALGSWASWWTRKARGFGMKKGQLGLLIVDEPSTDKQAWIIVEYAGVIRLSAPDFVIWENPSWTSPSDAPARVFEKSDVLSPPLRFFFKYGSEFREFYATQLQSGKELGFSLASDKLLDPYGHYRLSGWFCWKYGAKGSSFWSFGDASGAAPWDSYALDNISYTPLFLGHRSVVHGKHMEAIREGVEDYEYLAVLDRRIKELELRGEKPELLNRAKDILSKGTAKVVTGYGSDRDVSWNSHKNRSIADDVRIQLLNMLAELQFTK